MIRNPRLPILPFSVMACAILIGVANGDETVFEKPAPEGIADLRVIERAAIKVAKDAISSTVGLQIGMAQGSGVIVSQNGFVLTAAHVSGAPGRDAAIRLPDGTVLRGRTLGIHTAADIGLIKISGDGPWPHVDIVPVEEAPIVGDWCLVTGHPSGFQADRSPPVRVGRLIDVEQDVLRTDCPLAGGDSGGPLFDLQGRLIGIHSRIADDITLNLHGPALAGLLVWDELERGEVYPPRPPSQFLDRLDLNRDGKLSRNELPAGYFRRVFDRLAEELQIDPGKDHSIKQLTDDWGWKATTIPVIGPTNVAHEQVGQSLRRRLFVRGRSIRAACSDAVEQVQAGTVKIECGGEQVALGAIVTRNGFVVTKASQLSDNPRCISREGNDWSATVVGIDSELDLALLKIEAGELTPVDWSSKDELPAGTWLVTPGVHDAVLTVGVVSVTPRKVVGPTAVLGVRLAVSDIEARVIDVFANSGAAEAGVSNGDVITRIMGRAVRNINELRAELENYRPSDVVKATIRRAGDELELEISLGAPEDVFFRFGRSRRLSGPLSSRRDDFAQVLQHDSVLHPAMCGGPVVDLSGEVVGINIARTDRVATYAIPAQAVQQFVERHR